MKKPAVRVYQTTRQFLDKLCRQNHGNIIVGGGRGTSHSPWPTTPTTTTTSSLLVVPPPHLTRMAAATEMVNICPPSYGNPCLDLFHHVRLEDGYVMTNGHPVYSHEYLKQLLPLAWSHNPLTTLKLICNLLDLHAKVDEEGFYTAAYWLFQNHPKTLACSLARVAASFGSLHDLLEILYRALEGEDVRRRNSTDKSALLREIRRGGRPTPQEKILAMANKALERYRLDPDYRLLHDTVSTLYAHCLKSDIRNLNKYHDRMTMNMINNGGGDDDHAHTHDHEEASSSKCLEITAAAYYCPCVNSSYDRATLICESIAKKVFPRGSEEEEEDYACRVRKQLTNDVLEPLRRALVPGPNRWGYEPRFKPELCAIKAYLEEVMKALTRGGGESSADKIIKADALLPNEIIRYVNDGEVRLAAQLQWKTMVDKVYLKQGKFKNCLAVSKAGVTISSSSFSGNVAAALTLLASQLSEEPWKGKLISFSFGFKPLLHSIKGEEGGDGDDLKSKCELLESLDCGEECEDDQSNDLEMVFDLILEVAAKGNLKPEQMIKKVFVLTAYEDFYGTDSERCWESDCEAIQKKFKDKGYGDVVPQIVFWKVDSLSSSVVCPTKQGVVMLRGFSKNLVKSFLDKDGDIGPEHVMESAISGQQYANLAVVD